MSQFEALGTNVLIVFPGSRRSVLRHDVDARSRQDHRRIYS